MALNELCTNAIKHGALADDTGRIAVQWTRTDGGERGWATTGAKAKFDDQIVAIAAVEGATAIYSDDEDIAKLAQGRFQVINIATIPLPPKTAQGNLPFGIEEQGGPKPQP